MRRIIEQLTFSCEYFSFFSHMFFALLLHLSQSAGNAYKWKNLMEPIIQSRARIPEWLDPGSDWPDLEPTHQKKIWPSRKNWIRTLRKKWIRKKPGSLRKGQTLYSLSWHLILIIELKGFWSRIRVFKLNPTVHKNWIWVRPKYPDPNPQLWWIQEGNLKI